MKATKIVIQLDDGNEEVMEAFSHTSISKYSGVHTYLDSGKSNTDRVINKKPNGNEVTILISSNDVNVFEAVKNAILDSTILKIINT